MNKENCALTLNVLTTTIVAPPSNASKWQMGLNLAFKGLNLIHEIILYYDARSKKHKINIKIHLIVWFIRHTTGMTHLKPVYVGQDTCERGTRPYSRARFETTVVAY